MPSTHVRLCARHFDVSVCFVAAVWSYLALAARHTQTPLTNANSNRNTFHIIISLLQIFYLTFLRFVRKNIKFRNIVKYIDTEWKCFGVDSCTADAWQIPSQWPTSSSHAIRENKIWRNIETRTQWMASCRWCGWLLPMIAIATIVIYMKCSNIDDNGPCLSSSLSRIQRRCVSDIIYQFHRHTHAQKFMNR